MEEEVKWGWGGSGQTDRREGQGRSKGAGRESGV